MKNIPMLKTFVFQQEQKGIWGWCLLSKRMVIKAVSLDEAMLQIKRRSDYNKVLRNGDMLTWRLIQSTVLLDSLVDKIQNPPDDM